MSLQLDYDAWFSNQLTISVHPLRYTGLSGDFVAVLHCALDETHQGFTNILSAVEEDHWLSEVQKYPTVPIAAGKTPRDAFMALEAKLDKLNIPQTVRHRWLDYVDQCLQVLGRLQPYHEYSVMEEFKKLDHAAFKNFVEPN